MNFAHPKPNTQIVVRWRDVSSGRGAVVEVSGPGADLKFDIFISGARPHWHRYQGHHDDVSPLDAHDPVAHMVEILSTDDTVSVADNELEVLAATVTNLIAQRS